MKRLIFTFLILFGLFTAPAWAQKYTINFTPASLTVNEDIDTIWVSATISPKPAKPVGIDVKFDPFNGDYKPFSSVSTLDYSHGNTVAHLKISIIKHKGNTKRVHYFRLIDFLDTFKIGKDSVFKLTILDNDSTQETGIKSIIGQNPDFQFFPNPAKGMATLITPQNLSGLATICLFDITGKFLKSWNENAEPGRNITLQMPEGLSGIFLIRLESGTYSGWKRIVLE